MCDRTVAKALQKKVRRRIQLRRPSLALASSLRLTLSLVGLALALTPSRVAFAKSVTIEWEVIPGAKGYEIEVEKNGKKLFGKSLEENRLKGQLKPGLYSYKLRALDRLKRPGLWSDRVPLVVLPDAPSHEYPQEEAELKTYDATAEVILKWKPLEGASRFEIELRRDNEPVDRKTIGGTEWTIPDLKPGSYSWRITGVITDSAQATGAGKGDAPAGTSEAKIREWRTPSSDWREFSVVQEPLETPTILYPRGTVDARRDGKIRVHWEPVAGATGYEIQISPQKSDPADPRPEVLLTSNSSNVTAKLAEGPYEVKVQALVSSASGKSMIRGPASVETFQTIHRTEKGGGGYVAVSTMAAPYAYKVASPQTGSGGTTSSIAGTVRLSAEYWLAENFALSGLSESTSARITEVTYQRWTFELGAKTRYALGAGSSAWQLLPKLGVEYRDYFEIMKHPGTGQTLQQNIGTLGATVGVNFRKRLNDRWSLGFYGTYFYPVALQGVPAGSQLTGDASYRNMSIGLQALYWTNAKWSLAFGTLVEKRSISVKPMLSTGLAPASEQVFMDGIYFFGSLIYTFGGP